MKTLAIKEAEGRKTMMTNKVLEADDHRDLMEKFIQADATLGHDMQRRFEETALELESLMSQVERTIH